MDDGSSPSRAPDNETFNHHCDSPRAADAKSPPDKWSPRFGGIMAVCNCVYGNVARVVYSRTFPDQTEL